jgi:hypothetical protein
MRTLSSCQTSFCGLVVSKAVEQGSFHLCIYAMQGTVLPTIDASRLLVAIGHDGVLPPIPTPLKL